MWQELVDLTPAPPEVCLENRLKELGLGPEDFRWVVMGHLHTDHAGGLRIFQDANVDIVVHEDEYNHVQSMQEDSENFFAKVDFAFLDDQKPTTVSGDSIDLTSDVRLVSLPGHTPGQMGMMVRLDTTGWVMLTSDALYHHDSYGPPAVGSPIVWESEKWRSSVETHPHARHRARGVHLPRATTRPASSSSPTRTRDAHDRVLARLRVRVTGSVTSGAEAAPHQTGVPEEDAEHLAAVVAVVGGRPVHAAAVVPEDHVVGPPHVAVHEAVLGGVLDEAVEDGVAGGVVAPDDRLHAVRVEVEAAPAGRRGRCARAGDRPAVSAPPRCADRVGTTFMFRRDWYVCTARSAVELGASSTASSAS